MSPSKDGQWKRKKAADFQDLHGIYVIHSSNSEAQALLPIGRPSYFSQGCLQSQKLLIQSDSTQNFQLWNFLGLKKLWDRRPPWLRLSSPHCGGDRHIVERAANVLTSIPFILIGLQAPRNKLANSLYANSVVGVGLASGFYHSSKGDARHFFRWGDYMMIAASTLLLSRALRKNDSVALTVASAAILPVQPALVSALHVGLLEFTFAQRAQTEPQLRKAHALHTASTIVGCALFVADDVFPEIPYLHAAWHVAAAVGTATCIKLLE